MSNKDESADRTDYEEMMDEVEKMSKSKENITSFVSEIKQLSITKTRSPQLNRLFEALSTIRPTSVASERLFSLAGNIITKTRNRLDRISADSLVFLKCYLKLN